MHGGWRWVALAVLLGACGDSKKDEDAEGGPGPWPTDAVKDYTAAYGLGAGVRSVGVDEAHNLWLLRGAELGVLRPGDTEPTWTRGVGQAAEGFGRDKKALGSTVICGGEAGRAYVGYHTYELQREVPDKPHAYIPAPGEPHYSASRFAEYQKGEEGDTVYVGTDGEGLWRLEADGEALARVDEVKGSKVLQLVYDPTVSPAMLYVLTDAGLTVLRGD